MFEFMEDVVDFVKEVPDAASDIWDTFKVGNSAGFDPNNEKDLKFMAETMVYSSVAQVTVGAGCLIAGVGILKTIGVVILVGGTYGFVTGSAYAYEKGKEIKEGEYIAPNTKLRAVRN
jgi:hypothetical protein